MIKLSMKYFIIFFLFFTACAGSSKYMKPAESLMQPTEEKAIVRFMRPSGLGYAINFNIWDGARVIGNSVARSQFDYIADPGKHLFVAIAENKTFLEAELKAGKTYYILTQVKMGAWKARVGLIAVSRGSEYWSKVAEYENSLTKLQPNMEALKQWQNANKSVIEAILNQYETEWKATKAWPVLHPEDGR